MATAKAELVERFVTSALSETSARLRDERYGAMFEAIIESGALSPEAQESLAAQLDPKALANVDDLAEMLHQMQDMIDAMGRKIDRAVETQARFKRILAGVKSGIETQMRLWTLRKICGNTNYFLLAKNPASVEIVDENLIPSEFVEYVPKISREKIKEALESGREVPGAVLHSDRSHLVIK